MLLNSLSCLTLSSPLSAMNIPSSVCGKTLWRAAETERERERDSLICLHKTYIPVASLTTLSSVGEPRPDLNSTYDTTFRYSATRMDSQNDTYVHI